MERTHIRHFDAFALDSAAGTLAREGDPIALAPQPMRLLELLVERAGRLVTHEEIRGHLWPDRVVDYERGMHFCVAQVRTALGESASDARLIVTVPGRGYRLAVAVDGPGHDRARSIWPRWRSAAAAVAVLAIALTAWAGRPTELGQNVFVAAPTAASAFGADLTAALRTSLDGQPGLRIVDRAGDGVWRLDTIWEQGEGVARLHARLTRDDGSGAIAFEVESTTNDVDRLALDLAWEVERAFDRDDSEEPTDVETTVVQTD